MSAKKKEKSVVQMEVEDELARAAKELEGGLPPASSSAQKPDQSDFKDLFTEMLRQQALTNSQIVKSLQDTQKSGQAVVSAVQSLQQATLINKTPMPANTNANANPNIIQLDESPGESEAGLLVSCFSCQNVLPNAIWQDFLAGLKKLGRTLGRIFGRTLFLYMM